MREETLAIIPRFWSTAPVSPTMTSSEKGYYLSLTTKGALLFSPAVAPLLQDSGQSLHNRTLPSLASPTSDIGCVENACCPGNVAIFRGDHESVQRRPCNKYGKRNSWALSQHMWAQSKNLTNITGPHVFFIL